MALETIIASIGAGVVWLFSKISGVATFAVHLFSEAIKVIYEAISWFLRTAPKPLKIIVFLFLFLFLANTIIGTLLGVHFTCLSSNELRTYRSPFGFIEVVGARVFTNIDNSTMEWDDFIENRTIKHGLTTEPQDVKGVVRVRCFNERPRLTVFGIDVFSFELWVLLIAIGTIFMVKKWIDDTF